MFPLIFILMNTYGLFTIGDLLRVNLFVAINGSIRKMWLANILFTTVVSGIFAFIVLFFYYMTGQFIDLLYVEINFIEVIYSVILSFPIALFFIGMSTIHFYDYGKFSLVISSIFALFNLAILALPIFVQRFQIDYLKYVLPISLLCLLAFIGIFYLMGHPKIDELIYNTQKEVGVYDKKMLSLDE